ncbi:MAG: carbon storage regulator CsrA [Planctomycetota bacterium]
MLVLSRQRDETIMIGDDVEITVVDIRGDKVRLGINAPRTVQVHRKEVYRAIQKENAEAAHFAPNELTRLRRGLANARPASMHAMPVQRTQPSPRSKSA